MSQLAYFIYKELILLGRDLHGLLLLFIMPLAFILIMSFALQNQYASKDAVSINYYVINQDGGEGSTDLIAELDKKQTFRRLSASVNEEAASESKPATSNGSIEMLRQAIRNDKASLLLIIAADYEDKLSAGETVVIIETAPATTPAIAQLFAAQVKDILGQAYLNKVIVPLLEESGLEVESGLQVDDLLQSRSLFRGKSGEQIPSSVQQNVPAWLLFAMFFIAIPLSTTLISERDQGTLSRLQTMAFPQYYLFVGKLIPYFVINLLQVVAMLLVGVYLMPALGGDQLLIGNGFIPLTVIAMAVSLAAVSYALLIAQLANTTEQATIFVGASNIIMAALGGIMVPRFVMPPAMQELSLYSPMAWGLEGFLDVLLRGGQVADVLPEAARLVVFAFTLLGLSVIISKKRGIVR